jgi:hypothetical protein
MINLAGQMGPPDLKDSIKNIADEPCASGGFGTIRKGDLGGMQVVIVHRTSI